MPGYFYRSNVSLKVTSSVRPSLTPRLIFYLTLQNNMYLPFGDTYDIFNYLLAVVFFTKPQTLK